MSLHPVFLAEAGLSLLFLSLLVVSARRGLGITDAVLWGLVWATRVLSSLNGAKHFPAVTPQLNIYIGFQALSAIALTVILFRSESRLFREKWLRQLLLRITGISVSHHPPEPAPEVDRSRVIPGNLVCPDLRSR